LLNKYDADMHHDVEGSSAAARHTPPTQTSVPRLTGQNGP